MPKIPVSPPVLRLPELKRIPDFIPVWELMGGGMRRSYVLPKISLRGDDVGYYASPSSAAGLIELFGSKEDFITVRFADRIELAALRNTKTWKFSPNSYVEEDAKELKAPDAEFLRAMLTCDACYWWGHSNYSDSDYRFRIRFHRKDRVVIMDLCLDERSVRIVTNKSEFPDTSFEFGYPSVVVIIERYFPGESSKDG